MLRGSVEESRLATEAVESAALPLEGVDDIEGGDGLALGVLSVCDCVADDALKEGLQNTASLFVDHCRRSCQIMLDAKAVVMVDAYWQRYA